MPLDNVFAGTPVTVTVAIDTTFFGTDTFILNLGINSSTVQRYVTGPGTKNPVLSASRDLCPRSCAPAKF